MSSPAVIVGVGESWIDGEGGGLLLFICFQAQQEISLVDRFVVCLSGMWVIGSFWQQIPNAF